MDARPRGGSVKLAVASFACAIGFSPVALGEVTVGAGVVGTAGGNFLDQPDRSTLQPDIYPGYGGGTFGGGFMLDVRVLNELLGLEADIIRSSDKGHGDVTSSSAFGGQTYRHTIGQSAWHLPLLIKLTLNIPLVAPQFFAGPEFVFPSTPDSTLEPPPPGISVAATADDYVALTGGFGVEFKLPIPGIDLRLPLGLRFSFNPNVPGDFAKRVTQTSPTSAVYHSEWKHALNATLGAALFF